MPLEDLMKMYSGAFDADEPEDGKAEEVESLPPSPDAVKEESSSESKKSINSKMTTELLCAGNVNHNENEVLSPIRLFGILHFISLQ